MHGDVLAIIRSAGERTEEVCRALVAEQVPEKNIITITDKPFSATLKKSFEAAIDFNLPWTVCFDADVLISRDAMAHVTKEAGAFGEKTFGASFSMVDRFYGGRKSALPHLYRTSLLKKAMSYFEASRTALRPETEIKSAMEAAGHPMRYSRGMCGLHDFEQFYVDIFRKTATRAQKSKKDVPGLLAFAEKNSREGDFRVATWGLKFGMCLSEKDVLLHRDQWQNIFECLLAENGMTEKGSLKADKAAVRPLVSSEIFKCRVAEAGRALLHKLGVKK